MKRSPVQFRLSAPQFLLNPKFYLMTESFPSNPFLNEEYPTKIEIDSPPKIEIDRNELGNNLEDKERLGFLLGTIPFLEHVISKLQQQIKGNQGYIELSKKYSQEDHDIKKFQDDIKLLESNLEENKSKLENCKAEKIGIEKRITEFCSKNKIKNI